MRAGEGNRTLGLPADNRMLSPLSYVGTCVPGGGFEPSTSAVWERRLYRWATRACLRGHDSGSNRAPQACKARLCTSTLPMEPTVGIEPTTSAVRRRRTALSASLANEPEAGLEPAVFGLQNRRRSRPAPPAWCPRRESNPQQPGSRPGASTRLGYRGELPRLESNRSLRRSERRVLPIDDEGKAAAGSRTPTSAGGSPGPAGLLSRWATAALRVQDSNLHSRIQSPAAYH